MSRTTCALLATVVSLLAPESPGQTLIVEALSGDPLAGGLPGEVIEQVASGSAGRQPPRLGNGDIFYRITTQVPDGDGRVHLRFGPVGEARTILQPGSLPLPPGVRMNLVDASTRIAPDGSLVALGFLLGDGVGLLNDEAFLTRSPEGAVSVFRKGDHLLGAAPGVTLGGRSSLRQPWSLAHWDYRVAPGGGASVTGQFGSLVNNQIAGNGAALVVPASSSLITAHAYAGPGMPGSPVEGGTIHALDDNAPSVNTRGEQAFMYIADVGAEVQTGIGIATQGSIRSLVSGDTPVASHPGLMARVGLGQLGWNDAGEAAFVGEVRSGAGDSRQAVLLHDGSTLTMLAQAGDALPGRPGETMPSSLPAGHAPRLAADGSVAFDTGTGVWYRPAGEDPRMLFSSDSPARPPELTDLRLVTSSLSINAEGQVVAALYTPGTSAVAALVAFDPGLGEVLLAAVGRPLELRPGVVRQVQHINFTGAFDGVRAGAGQDGAPAGINSAGQIVFGVTFTTGETAVVVATVPAVSSSAIALPLLLCTLGRRRSRGRLFP